MFSIILFYVLFYARVHKTFYLFYFRFGCDSYYTLYHNQLTYSFSLYILIQNNLLIMISENLYRIFHFRIPSSFSLYFVFVRQTKSFIANINVSVLTCRFDTNYQQCKSIALNVLTYLIRSRTRVPIVHVVFNSFWSCVNGRFPNLIEYVKPIIGFLGISNSYSALCM